jgi:AcrR family transcriptional regulator
MEAHLGKKRATNPTEKETRREAILAVALGLFAETSFPALRMEDVAARAGLAKGTLYLYFRTKEELFLALLQREFAGWFAEIDAALEVLKSEMPGKRVSTRKIANAFTRSLVERPAFIRLAAILHGVLEQNADAQAILSFKRILRDGMLETGARLEALLLELEPGAGAQALLVIYALLVGIQQLAEPAPALQPLVSDPELTIFQVSFAETFEKALNDYLNGFYAGGTE